MKLVDTKDDISEKMEQVGKVNSYYHHVYLLFFKPYLQHTNLMKSLSKGNVGGIEQDKNALLKYATEGVAKLDQLRSFNGDNSLKLSCKSLLQFYAKVSNDYMKPIMDYMLAKERFESMKKDFDKKSDHTKEEVDGFNKAVNDINAALKKYNEANSKMTDAGNESLNDWNKVVNDYFNEQMPR